MEPSDPPGCRGNDPMLTPSLGAARASDKALHLLSIQRDGGDVNEELPKKLLRNIFRIPHLSRN